MLIRVTDFETTGVPPDAAVCEAGWSDVCGDDFGWTVGNPFSMLVDPGRPMPPEARAVHHLSDEDCVGAPQATTAFMKLMDGADGSPRTMPHLSKNSLPVPASRGFAP